MNQRSLSSSDLIISLSLSLGILLTAVLIIRYLKWRDSSLVLMSAIISISCSLFLGLSTKNWHVYLSALLSAGVGIGNGACRSGKTKTSLLSMRKSSCTVDFDVDDFHTAFQVSRNWSL